MSEICTIYTTFADRDEACKVIKNLLDENLIACANIIDGMMSVYKWQGELCQEREVAVLLKTTTEQSQSVISRVTELHSYDIPCVVQWDITDANPDYENWLKDCIG